MLKLFSLSFILMLFGCYGGGSTDSDVRTINDVESLEPQYNVRFHIVDKDGNSITPTVGTWSYVYVPGEDNKIWFQCVEKECVGWELGFDVQGDIEISFSKEIEDNDEYCINYIRGETIVFIDPAVQQDVTVVLDEEGMGCI